MEIPSLTTDQMIEVDRLMIEHYHIELIQMMENAGRNLAELTYRWLDSVQGKRVVVLCGAGNNGGGGMVAARHLHNRGAQVQAFLATDPSRLKDVPAHQWQILQAMGLASESAPDLETADVILDALIGYGLTGDPRGRVADWIAQVNASGKPVISLDAPSGLDTTTGQPGRFTVHAAATLTLALPKVGLLTEAARSAVGELYLADISVPSELYRHLGLNVPPLFEKDVIIKL